MVLLLVFAAQGGAQVAAQVQPGSGLEPVQQPDQAATTPEPARVTAHGVVRNAASGEPLARVLVQIEGDADAGALTDGEGRFEIPGIPVGPQTFRIVKPGFHDRPYATEETGLQSEGPAHTVLLTAQMADLDFALAPNCAIHGRIELSTGDPADGISVMLFKQVVRFGRMIWVQEATTRSNGNGAYRFSGLPDGAYVLATQPALESEPAVTTMASGSAANIIRSGYPSVFYPDVREFGGASRIRVSGGAQAEANFSLALEPFYPVTAFAGAPNDPAGAGKSIQQGAFTAIVMDSSGQILPYTAQYDSTTRSLQANLPNGTYTLAIHGTPQAHSVEVANLVPLAIGSVRGFAGAVDFAVAGHPVTGLRIPVGTQAPATLNLRYVRSSNSPAAAAAFSAGLATELVNLNIDQAGIPLNSSDGVWSMTGQQDSIQFTAQPGSYWLTAYLPRRSLCAGALTAGGLNLAREPLVLGLAAGTQPMELSLRDDCATLALTLPPSLAVFLPGEEPYYTVYIVPDFDTVQDVPPMTVHPSSGATLTIDGLTPGSYHVYTFDSPVHLEYRNPAALAALANPGQQIALSAGTTGNLMLEVPGH